MVCMTPIIGGHGGQVGGQVSYTSTNVGVQAMSTLSTGKTACKNGLFPCENLVDMVDVAVKRRWAWWTAEKMVDMLAPTW